VLGEQSAKSMRGKDVTDLLYRGNNTRATKAKVEIEFTKSKSHEPANRGSIENIFVKNALEKEEVIVSRTVYADGKSEYMMNGVEVRVKDLQEFLLYIHLGNKSSWHISQGEADRVLQASPTERKTIIEDALGLKVYHARINDSQRKLEKTRENIREATLKRREIMPELSALSKQVEKIKRSSEFRTELTNKSSVYLLIKKDNIEKIKHEDANGETIEELHKKLLDTEKSLAEKERSLYKGGGHDVQFLERELEKEERVLHLVKAEHDNLESKFRSAQNNLEYLKVDETRNIDELNKTESELKTISSEGNDIIFSEKYVNSTREVIDTNTKKIESSESIVEVKNLAKDTDFAYKKLLSMGAVVSKDNVKQISYLQGIKNRVQEKLLQIKNDKKKFEEEVSNLKTELEKSELKSKIQNERVEGIKKQVLEYKYLVSETEREVQSLTFERSRVQIKITQKQDHVNKIMELQSDFESDLKEFRIILGNNFTPHVDNTETINVSMGSEEFQSLKRSIERLKIRLEESIVSNPDEVMQNFQNMTERDEFLLREITDLENSMLNLEKLITDLKENLKLEFDNGLLHINNVFDSYVKKLFGGGGAKVYIIEIPSYAKASKGEEPSEDPDDSEVVEVKTGIEVEVEIPKKKVKGLHSLSGGERALVSIALNFSIINQNPAPFMILDETDAALDEANSKRYGEILEMLKQNTKLIVVTHNRETMHFADQVYGVTLAKDGHSKVLSVSFEDAIEYAK
jgi:chromosome segregation protein